MIVVSTGAEAESSGPGSSKMPHTGKVGTVAENQSDSVVFSRPAEQRVNVAGLVVQ